MTVQSTEVPERVSTLFRSAGGRKGLRLPRVVTGGEVVANPSSCRSNEEPHGHSHDPIRYCCRLTSGSDNEASTYGRRSKYGGGKANPFQKVDIEFREFTDVVAWARGPLNTDRDQKSGKYSGNNPSGVLVNCKKHLLNLTARNPANARPKTGRRGLADLGGNDGVV